MERVVIDDVEPDVAGDATRRSLTDPLDTSHVAINHYRLAPGERAAGLHAHLDQEEAFLVVDGEAAVETLSGEVGVEAGEANRFPAGEYHSGLIADGGPVSALALGAPAKLRNCASRCRVPTAATTLGGRDSPSTGRRPSSLPRLRRRAGRDVSGVWGRRDEGRPGRRRRYRRRCLPWVWLRDHGLNDPLDDHVDHPDRPSATNPPRRPAT